MKLAFRKTYLSSLAVMALLLTVLMAACGDNTATTTSAATAAATTASSAATTAAANGSTTTAAASGSAAAASSLGPIPKGPAQINGTIVVALNTEITGAGSQTGELARKAAEIAVDKINNTGGVNGQKIELKVEDAQSSNTGALAALNKAADDKAVAMVGPVKSTQILAINDRIKELKMPALIGGTNVTLTQKGNEWVFRFRPNDGIAGNAMANFLLNDKGASKIGILHDSDAFGTGGADVVEAAVKKAGKQVAKREKYTTGSQDFTAQLLSIKSAGADALVIYGTNAQDDAVILRQIKEQGMKIPVVGSPSFGQTIVTSLASDVTEGVYVVQDFFTGRTPEYNEYAKAWQTKFNSEPDGLSAWNWDAIHLLSRIIAQVGTDNSKIREALSQVKGYQGAVGLFDFTRGGDGLNSVDVAQYKDKKLVFIRNVAVS